jgi:hypothetical protein
VCINVLKENHVKSKNVQIHALEMEFAYQMVFVNAIMNFKEKIVQRRNVI